MAGAPGGAANATMGMLRSPTVLGAGGAALAAAPEALRVGDVLTNPKATWNDVGTQAAEGVGRLGAAGAGAAGGAVLGSVLGPVGAGVGGIAGGLYGYWAGDKAIRALRGASGLDERSPAVQLGAPVAQTRVQTLTGEKPTIATAPVTPTAPTAAPSIRQPFSDVRNGTYNAADNPPDLTGKIVRNGNTYTGSNIKAGADIVDPTGKLLNTNDPNNPLSLRTTGVSGPVNGDASSSVGGVPAGGASGRSVMDILANTSRINSQISETARGLDAYGPGGAGGGGPAGINGNGIFDTLRATQRSGAPATRAERMAQAELENRAQIAAAQNGVTLRGQDVSASTARANTRDTVGATLRGQDMDYAEKMDSKRLDVAVREAQRRAISSAWQGTSDPQVAAARLAAAGFDPASALAVAGGQRAAAESSDKNFDNITRAAGVTTDKDGKPVLNPALQAVAQNVIANAMPGVRNAAPAAQNARLREVQATGNLAAGLQETQGGSLLQTIGWDKAPPAISTLPNLEGATLRERGFGSPFANASRGDYELVQPDGTVAPIKRSRVGERELDYLKQQGVSLRN